MTDGLFERIEPLARGYPSRSTLSTLNPPKIQASVRRPSMIVRPSSRVECQQTRSATAGGLGRVTGSREDRQQSGFWAEAGARGYQSADFILFPVTSVLSAFGCRFTLGSQSHFNKAA